MSNVTLCVGVTKGARHKLLLSIKKLSERGAVLAGVEAELRGGAPAARALERLRAVLLSPMPPACDLPAAIVRALHLGTRHRPLCSATTCAATYLLSIINLPASKCLNKATCQPAVRVPSQLATEDGDHEPPVDPMSLHCWLVEKVNDNLNP